MPDPIRWAFAVLALLVVADAAAQPALPGQPCQLELPAHTAWLESERWAWREICEGRDGDFNARLGGPRLDPAEVEGWDERRAISGRFLATILLHSPYRESIPLRGATLIGAWFRDEVNLQNGRIERELWLDDSRFEKDVVLADAAASQVLSLEGVRIGGRLLMQRFDATKSVSLRGGSFALATLAGSTIGGQLTLSGARFDAGASLDSITIRHDLKGVPIEGGRPFSVGGPLILTGAKIGGLADLSGARLERNATLNSAAIGMALMLRDAEILGRLDITYATVAQRLQLEGARLGEVDLTGSRISGELGLVDESGKTVAWRPAGRMTLVNARVEAIVAGELSWPPQLALFGFAYDRLGSAGTVGDMARGGSEPLIAWLARDPSFSPQPYAVLADVLVSSGWVNEADDVRYAGRERARHEAWLRGDLSRWTLLSIQKWTIGYGLGPARYLRLLIWVAVILVFGVAVLRWTGEGRRLKMPYGISYAFDSLIPGVTLRQHHVLIELRSPARYCFYLVKLLGWVLASMGIAGISGLTH